MKRKILSLVLALAMCLTLLPMAAVADAPEAKAVYTVSGGEGYTFESGGDYVGTFITGEGNYEITTDLSGGALIVNNAAVTLGAGGAVNTEDLYIFGANGRLTVGSVTFTTGHSNTITNASDENIVASAVRAANSTAVKIAGALGVNGADESLTVKNATVIANNVLTLGEGARLTISGSFTAAADTIKPAQNAQITVRGGTTFSGMTFYDETGTVVWQNFENEETFVFIATDDGGNAVNKWVRYTGNDELRDFDYRVTYGQDEGSIFVKGEGESWNYVGDGWRGNFGVGDPAEPGAITLKLDNTKKYDNGEEIPEGERVAVNAYIRVRGGEFEEWAVVANNPANASQFEHTYTFEDGEFSFTPTTSAPLEILVCWTAERYNFENFRETYMVEYEVNGSGSVSVSGGTQVSYENHTKIGWTEGSPASVVFTVTPDENETLNNIWIEQDNPQNVNLGNDSRYDSDAGTFTLAFGDKYFDENQTSKFAFLRFDFTGGEPGPGSGYDSFGPTEELPYLVEFHWNGAGNVTVQGEYDQMPNGNNMKVRVANTVESLTFELHPNENERIDGIRVEQDGVAETNPDGFVDLDNDNRYNRTDNTFTLNLTDSRYNDSEATGIKFVNINFDFTGGEPGPQGPGENQYRMFYSVMGSVADADDGAVRDFTANSQITWTLTYPQNVTNLYRVEINVNGEPGNHFEYNDGADNNDTEITVNNTAKTVSYTPTSTDPFEVFIYWTEQDRFDQFRYDENTEIQLRCRVRDGFATGTSINAPWCDCAQDGGWREMKINVPKETASFTITFANNEGYEFDKAVFADAQDSALPVSTTEGITYTWTAANYQKELNVYFKSVGEPGPGPGPGPNPPEPQGGINWEALESALENYIFAYGGSTLTEAQAKELVCKELSERHIGEGLDYSLGEALGKGAAALAEFVDVQGNPLNSGAAFAADSGNKVNKPYYSMEIRIEDVDPDTEGNQTFSVQTNVYVLDTARDLIVESYKGDTTQYQIVTLSEEEFDTTCAYIDADRILGVCGNAVMCNGIEGGGKGIYAAHVTQDHAGGINTFPFGARLVLTLEQDTVQIASDYGGDAAPWSFQNAGVYSGSGTADDPVEATVFYGAPSVRLEKATGSKTITGVEVTNLPAAAIQYIPVSGTVNFKTHYDEITLKITYNDESTSYLTLNFVGLSIGAADVDKKADVLAGDRFSNDDKDACTGDSFNVWHGTDQSVRYAYSEEKAVIGTFYYADETVIDKFNDGSGYKYYIGTDHSGTAYDTKAEAVEAYYNGLRHVSLYVTVTRTNGSVEHKIIDSAITMTGNAVNNGGFITDTDNAPGYAGQGSNHFYDDFVLWSGSSTDFYDIASVSAIVYEEGSADSFGGVRVGSGAGFTWNRSAR